jgi:hypothetical protein
MAHQTFFELFTAFFLCCKNKYSRRISGRRVHYSMINEEVDPVLDGHSHEKVFEIIPINDRLGPN